MIVAVVNADYKQRCQSASRPSWRRQFCGMPKPAHAEHDAALPSQATWCASAAAVVTAAVSGIQR